MEEKFTQEEIEILYSQSGKYGNGERSSHLWRRAFNYYNAHHEKKLQMACAPCYYKVLLFIYKTELAKHTNA
jgi:hypothetical protein